MDGAHWEFWLNMTNFALGLITFLALFVVIGAIAWDLLARRAHDKKALTANLKSLLETDVHSQFVPGLGVTMADGGEKIDPPDPDTLAHKRSE